MSLLVVVTSSKLRLPLLQSCSNSRPCVLVLVLVLFQAMLRVPGPHVTGVAHEHSGEVSCVCVKRAEERNMEDAD